MLNFINAGLMTQWTDLGRTHNQVSGYSQSGAVDWFNFQLANFKIHYQENFILLQPTAHLHGWYICFTFVIQF